ncbi:MAG: S41 family peptidase [Betaproteobacteria bacterium]
MRRPSVRRSKLLLVALFALPLVAAAQVPATGTIVEYVDRNDFPDTPGGLFFYTSDPTEQSVVDVGAAGAFFRTGRNFAAGGPTPVCRFYGSVTPGPNSHFYTVDPAECSGLMAAQVKPTPAAIQQWNYEGLDFKTSVPVGNGAGRTCPAGTVPVLRAYNNAFPLSGPRNPWDSNHRFTRFQADIDALVGQGWRDEGVVLCAPASSTTNVFASSALLTGKCVAPRADPGYGDSQGTLTSEKAWVRSYMDETYLWYNEVPNLAAADYRKPEDYFSVLKTAGRTASGRSKDRFHFYYDTPTWEALEQGTSSGYGFEVAGVATTPPRKYYVAYAEPNSPASAAGIARGAQILKVDGADLVNGNDINTLNAGLFPATAGESHTFQILDLGAGAPRTVTLISADVITSPVQNVKIIDTPTGKVGYLLFNDHNYPAEGQLVAAVGEFKQAGVVDVILDLRYNGGGLLYIASQLSYMVAGPASHNKIFEKLTYNDKRNAETNDPNNIYPFFDTTSGFSGTGTTADSLLPFLGFNRVYVLTSNGTASASEAIINSLQGIGVTVVRVGTTTFGKPYGFSPRDNCGFTYFSVEFKGTNDVGYGDYDDGFAPTCQLADDFTHALGDVGEARLAAALTHRQTGACPPGTAVSSIEKSQIVDPMLFRSPLRENRILRKPSNP